MLSYDSYTVTDRSFLHSGSEMNLTIGNNMYKFGN